MTFGANANSGFFEEDYRSEPGWESVGMEPPVSSTTPV